ncbi:hypothetical protein EJ08DRAFT_370822 [Tothia fuscella]|uniref:Uncharacterized protein n=1 Tax=Tothia fuscella TaxID=1048955 RepID=A0A9P4NLN6_9PEZI|nr:hypothetical protein EJ08DRAFT_370822 [Tothia fuscella]
MKSKLKSRASGLSFKNVKLISRRRTEYHHLCIHIIKPHPWLNRNVCLHRIKLARVQSQELHHKFNIQHSTSPNYNRYLQSPIMPRRRNKNDLFPPIWVASDKATNSTSFLDLPRELRNLIYEDCIPILSCRNCSTLRTPLRLFAHSAMGTKNTIQKPRCIRNLSTSHLCSKIRGYLLAMLLSFGNSSCDTRRNMTAAQLCYSAKHATLFRPCKNSSGTLKSSVYQSDHILWLWTVKY